MNELNYTYLKTDQNWKYKGIPRTCMADIKTTKWLPSDTEELFDKNKPKGWTKDCITYDFNEYGYRSMEFVDDNNFTIASYGCSYTTGIGINAEDTWSQKFCDRLQQHKNTPVNNFNLSWPGSSMDFMCRTMYQTLPILKLDLVLLLLPGSVRLECYDNEGMALLTSPHVECYGHLDRLLNQYECENNFYKNFSFIKLMLDYYDIPWLFSTYMPYDKDINNDDNHVGSFDRLKNDRARDMSHPGPISNNNMANLFFEGYKKLNI